MPFSSVCSWRGGGGGGEGQRNNSVGGSKTTCKAIR